ncbi:MAG TPA: EamA family transporter, partial [Tepidisphaeraceae bacterium]|nr:EamA family transporter [Tepidisphaeraceae bacterium]
MPPDATPHSPPPVLEYGTQSLGAPRPSRVLGVFLLLLASVLWSLSGVVVKVVRIDSVAFAFWRCVGAAAIMVLLLPLGRGRLPPAGWLLD